MKVALLPQIYKLAMDFVLFFQTLQLTKVFPSGEEGEQEGAAVQGGRARGRQGRLWQEGEDHHHHQCGLDRQDEEE